MNINNSFVFSDGLQLVHLKTFDGIYNNKSINFETEPTLKRMLKLCCLVNVLICFEDQDYTGLESNSTSNTVFMAIERDELKRKKDFGKIVEQEWNEYKKNLYKDIRNALFHGKFEFSIINDKNVIAFFPNRPHILSKEQAKLQNETDFFFSRSVNTKNKNNYMITVEEEDLYKFISKKQIAFNEDNSVLAGFALANLLTYLSLNNEEFKMDDFMKGLLASTTFSSVNLAGLFPLCFYSQDAIFDIEKKYAEDSCKLLEELRFMRDAIAHGKVRAEDNGPERFSMIFSSEDGKEMKIKNALHYSNSVREKFYDFFAEEINGNNRLFEQKTKEDMTLLH